MEEIRVFLVKGFCLGALQGESILFPTHELVRSLLLLRRLDCRAPILLCLWSEGADLKCGCFGGSGETGKARNYFV